MLYGILNVGGLAVDMRPVRAVSQAGVDCRERGGHEGHLPVGVVTVDEHCPEVAFHQSGKHEDGHYEREKYEQIEEIFYRSDDIFHDFIVLCS